MTPPAMLAEPETFNAHEDYVNTVRFAPDGRRLATCGVDNDVKIWTVPDWALESTLCGHERSVTTLAFTPDGDRLVSGSADRTVRVWSVDEGTCLTRVDQRISAIVAPDGDTVASETTRHDIAIWSLQRGTDIRMLAVGDRAYAMAFAPDGRTVVTAHMGRPAICWSVANGQAIREINSDAPLVSIAFLDEGRRMVATAMDATMHIWDVADGTLQSSIALGARGMYPIAVSPDGATIAVGSEHRLRLYDASSELLDDREVAPRAVNDVTWSPDGRRLALAGDDGRVRVWEM